MHYTVLIYGSENAWNQLNDAEKARISLEMGMFMKELAESGRLRGGSPLQQVATATTVRLKDGRQQRTPGPFAETKEQLGGYFVLEAADLDEVLAVVARMPPASPHGALEIRPALKV